ncbi:MAG TPA: protein phosphatase 2C domain-containing protein [Rhodanobacteraceae bacterium]|jgi:protein phosphatase|nr:protein phosphatase 2C domain-containing protein [Rhodanobacteraceae bacterium]
MIEFGHATHAGLRREHNEDTYWADADLGLFLVADGLGGHEHGELASALARDAVVAATRGGKGLSDAALRANDEILAYPHPDGATVAPMGTTLAALRLGGDYGFEIAWVGDSRIYLWSQGALKQLSRDDSVVQELVEQGTITADEARSHPQRNQITQALGITPPETLKIQPLAGRCSAGMQFLLCTDGLTEELDDTRIAAVLSRTDLAAQECVDHLLLEALDAGGRDNITVVLVRIR